MDGYAKQNNTPPAAADEAGSVERSQAVAGLDRRAVRTVDLTDDDLTDDDIAAIEASEMEPGFEQLNAEIDDA